MAFCGACGAIVTAWFCAGCCNRSATPTGQDPPSLSVDLASIDTDGEPPAPSHRCKRIGREHTVGQASSSPANLDNLLPFATEMGRGTALPTGFAVGALRQQGHGTEAIVITTNGDGSAWGTTVIGTSHGDADAPLVFNANGRLGLAVLEPAGASRHLRLAYVQGDQVMWQAQLLQGNDESLAYDVAVGKQRGVAVWDDITKGRKVSGIYLSTFDPNSLGNPTSYKLMTEAKTDADTPRIIPRAGGFWLLWIARKPQPMKLEDDTRYQAEEIAHQWLEATPLDEQGVQVAGVSKLSPTSGHVKVYDVTAGKDDSAVVYWRDDDTPSGSSGGQMFRAELRLGALQSPERVDNERMGEGAPNLMPGWLAVADSQRATGLAALSPDGNWQGELENEPTFGAGEPVASQRNDLLIARPDGLVSRLFVVRCVRPSPDTDQKSQGLHDGRLSEGSTTAIDVRDIDASKFK